MTNYEAPKVLLTNSGEGPYGNSGAPDPNDPIAYVTWTNHDGGSHSDLKFTITNLIFKTSLTATFTWKGKGKILSWTSKSVSDGVEVTMNDGVFVFTARLKNNSNETIECTFQATFDDMGDTTITGGYVGSYYKGHGQGYLGIASEFDIKVNAV